MKSKQFLKKLLGSASIIAAISGNGAVYASNEFSVANGTSAVDVSKSFDAKESLQSGLEAKAGSTLPATNGALIEMDRPSDLWLNKKNNNIDNPLNRVVQAHNNTTGFTDFSTIKNLILDVPIAGKQSLDLEGAELKLLVSSNLSNNTLTSSGYTTLEFLPINAGGVGFKETVITGRSANSSILQLTGHDTSQYTGKTINIISEDDINNAAIVFSADGSDPDIPTPIDQNFAGNGVIFIAASNRILTGSINGQSLNILRTVESDIDIKTSLLGIFGNQVEEGKKIPCILKMKPGKTITGPVEVRYSSQAFIEGDSASPTKYYLPGLDNSNISLDNDNGDGDISAFATLTFKNVSTYNLNPAAGGSVEANGSFAGDPQNPNEYRSALLYRNNASSAGNAIMLDIALRSKMQGGLIDIEGSYNITTDQGVLTAVETRFKGANGGYYAQDTDLQTREELQLIIPATRFVKLSGQASDIQTISSKITGMGIYTGQQAIKGSGSGAVFASPRFIAQNTNFDTSGGNITIGMTQLEADDEKTMQEDGINAAKLSAQDAVNNAAAGSDEEADAKQILNILEGTIATAELDNPTAKLINAKISLYGENRSVIFKSPSNILADTLSLSFKLNNSAIDIASPFTIPLKNDGTLAIEYQQTTNATEQIVTVANNNVSDDDRKINVPVTQMDAGNVFKYKISLAANNIDKLFADGLKEKILPSSIFQFSKPDGQEIDFESLPQDTKDFYSALGNKIDVENNNSQRFDIDTTIINGNVQIKVMDLRDDLLQGFRESILTDSAASRPELTRFTSRNSSTGKLPKVASRIAKIIDAKGEAAASKFVERVTKNSLRTDETTVNVVSSLGSAISSRIDTIASAPSAGDENMESTNFGLWLEPFYHTARQVGADNDDVGYMANTYGITVGFDNKINSNSIIGVAGSFTKTIARYDGGASDPRDRTRANNMFGFLYGSHDFANKVSIDGKLIYGQSKIRASQIIDDEEVLSNHKITIYGGQITGRYNFILQNGMVLTPLAGLSYTKFMRGASSNDAEGSPTEGLQTSRNGFYKLELIAGITASSVFEMKNSDLIVSPQIYCSIRHNTNRDGLEVINDFDDVAGESTPISSSPARTMFDIGAKVTFTKNALEYGIAYDTTFARNYTSHKGTIKLRINL